MNKFYTKIKNVIQYRPNYLKICILLDIISFILMQIFHSIIFGEIFIFSLGLTTFIVGYNPRSVLNSWEYIVPRCIGKPVALLFRITSMLFGIHLMLLIILSLIF